MIANKTALFIDGHHLYSVSRNLGFDVDYRQFLAFARAQGPLLRAYYYSAILDSGEYSPLKPLTDWLTYNGYTLVTKPAREFTDAEGRRRVKGSMDIEMVVDMLEIAPYVGGITLVSGNADFVRAVQAVKDKGVNVTVMSSLATAQIADELRRVADQFIEIKDVCGGFTRQQPARSGPRQTPAEPFVEPEIAVEVVEAKPRRRLTATA